MLMSFVSSGYLEWAFTHRKLAVARWLVNLLPNFKADVHHISARGWTAAFGLFGDVVDAPQYNAPCDDFLEFLSGSMFGDLNAQDIDGWSVMHRAAAYRTPQHVNSLLGRRASLETRTRGSGWTPPFCAVEFGNISTLKEIVKHSRLVLTVTDFDDWTLLHLAVSSKRLGIMRFLISRGADPHALSSPTFYVPFDELENRPLTPMDIARYHGSLIFHCYVGALEAEGYDVQVVEDEQEDLPDVFWPSLQAQDGEGDESADSILRPGTSKTRV